MILGRNTIQWTALISGAAGFAQLLITTLIPEWDAQVVAQIIGGFTLFLGVVIAFIANTYTTPSDDPKLKGGTPVTITNSQGATIGHGKVPLVPPTQ